MDQLSFDDLERWLPAPEWEGFYEVSDRGRARSLTRRIPTDGRGVRLCPGQILKPGTYRNGHKHVTLTRPGVRRTYQVHVLVMLAFAGPCPDGLQIRHLNGVPDDNRWATGETDEEVIAAGGNLRYGTAKENAEDRDLRHGTNYELNRTHCPQGHPYDDKNTYWAPNGWRQCRRCRAYQSAKRDGKL